MITSKKIFFASCGLLLAVLLVVFLSKLSPVKGSN